MMKSKSVADDAMAQNIVLRNLVKRFVEYLGEGDADHYDAPRQCLHCRRYANELGYIKHANVCLMEEARLVLGIADPEPTLAEWEESWAQDRKYLIETPGELTWKGEKRLQELNEKLKDYDARKGAG